MSDTDILVEIAMAVGELKADMAIVKADVAAMKGAPEKKRQSRVTWRTGLLTALLVTLVGTLSSCLGRIIIGH